MKNLQKINIKAVKELLAVVWSILIGYALITDNYAPTIHKLIIFILASIVLYFLMVKNDN